MTAKITPKEVLLYLNYLGYNNLNAQQLKEFVQDLKKLIKYEEHKRSDENIHTDSVWIPNGTSSYVQTKRVKSEEYDGTNTSTTDEFTTLHLRGTFASEAKTVSKKENVISVQIKKSKCKCHHDCAQHNKENEVVLSTNKEQLEELQNEARNLQLSERMTNKENTGNGSKKSGSIKSKSSFIRPPVQVKNKSDPVALYHYYKSLWDKYRVPGEDQRTELRWAIREKMLSGPRVS